MSLNWIQWILLFIGIILIVSALFKPKDSPFSEEKIEELLEQFIEQMNMENEEIFDKMKKAQANFSQEIHVKLKELEDKIHTFEQKADKAVHHDEATKALPEINQKYKQVLNLYQEGATIDLIAKKTQIGHGEIKLILELMKKGFHYG